MKITAFLLITALLLLFTTACNTQAPMEESTTIQAPEPVSDASSEPALVSAAASSSAAEPIPPKPVDAEWKVESPAQHGMDTALLEEIKRKMAASQMQAAVIVKDGVIVEEFYQDGYDANSLFSMRSVTKTVMGALIGIAIEQGVLEGVDVKLAEFYPQLANAENAGKEGITLEHLLTHTSGLGEGGADQSFESHVRSQNWVERYLSLPLVATPGSSFYYSTAGSHMLSAVLEQAAGTSSYNFAQKHLFEPLGIEDIVWTKDPQGVYDGGNGLSMSVRDAAKLGQLFLSGGNWRGSQLVPREWVEVSTSPHASGEPDKGQYGYQWWVWSFGGEKVYYALGYAGQFIFVVPDQNLVVAIASKSIWSDFTGQVCIREVIAACQ